MIVRYLFHYVVFVLVVLMMPACTSVYKNFKSFNLDTSTQKKSSLKVSVVLKDNLCSYNYDTGNLTVFSLGSVICGNVKTAVDKVFDKAYFYTSIDDVAPEKSDAVVIIKPKRAYAYSIRDSIPASFITAVALSVEFQTVDGKKKYATTIYGDGLDRRTFGLPGTRYESSMQRSMDDLAKNIYKELMIAPDKAVKNANTSERILSSISNFKKGAFTYYQYRDSKPDDWYIYALDERVQYKYRKYSYIIDPVSGKFESDVGNCIGNGLVSGPMVLFNEVVGKSSVRNYINDDYYKGSMDWKTYWDRRHGVMSSLRPSTYLQDSRNYAKKLGKVYIKELIGSIYDDHPLCEIVFEGNSLETATLSQSSCNKNYAAIGAYESEDVYHENTLSNTVKQWIKLRPGMTWEEVVELVGLPSNYTDTTLGYRVLFYEYGRIWIFNKSGLTCWQIK